jgi:hypothetical protein
MRLLQRILFAFQSLKNRDKFEAEMNEELADFLERDAQDRISRGQTRASAERSARVEMRGMQQRSNAWGNYDLEFGLKHSGKISVLQRAFCGSVRLMLRWRWPQWPLALVQTPLFSA